MSEQDRIRVATRLGDNLVVEVVPARREGSWALHESIDGGDAWTVTHVPTGWAIGGANDFDREEAHRLFDLLVARVPNARVDLGFAGTNAPKVKDDALRRVIAECIRDVVIGAPVGAA